MHKQKWQIMLLNDIALNIPTIILMYIKCFLIKHE